MATAPKLVPIRPKLPAKPSPLTPELKDFIDRAIVPALVKQYLAETEAEKDLAKLSARVASCGNSTAATLRERP